MNWKKTIGSGIMLWALMFVVVSVFIAFNIFGNSIAKVIIAIIAGAISYSLAKKLKPADIKTALTNSAIWVIVGVILDALVSIRFNPLIFQSKGLWLGYFLVLLAPILVVKKKGGASISTSNTAIKS